jgi:DNA-nicking Smr family endonuclease
MSSRRQGRQVSEEELRLWRGVVRDARPLREEPAPVAPEPPSPPTLDPELARDRFVPAHSPPQRGLALDPARPVGLDRRNWQRLKRGQLPIEARLDLHGATQEAAHRRLVQFVADAERRGLRCVLVVTGKGQAGGGILRHMVPRWLGESGVRERLIAYTPAQRHHGGSGALYLLIRRPRAGR